MFVPKKEKKTEEVLENEEFSSPLLTHNNGSIHAKKYPVSLMNCDTFHEEVLLTLEVLKKEQDVDLYDENNFLKTQAAKKGNKVFSKLFEKKKQEKQIDTETVNNIPHNLLKFLNNKKNG